MDIFVTKFHCREYGNNCVRANAFLLCMLSPVWRAKLCRGELFEAASSRTLRLGSNEREAFLQALDLGCGLEAQVMGGLAGLIALGQMADAYGMEEVCAAAEEAVLIHLSTDTCADALMLAQSSGLERVKAGCRALALGRFEAVAGTAGFSRLDAETLGGLLGDDGLVAGSEERVLEALAGWLRSDPVAAAPAGPSSAASDSARGARASAEAGGSVAVQAGFLLGFIQFARMRPEYLAALRSDGAHDGEAQLGGARAAAVAVEACGAGGLMREMAAEALSAQSGSSSEGDGANAGSFGRAGAASWRHLGGAMRAGAAAEAFAVVICGGRVWYGGWDGAIRVRDTDEFGTEWVVGGHRRVVSALAGWGGYLLSGSADSRIGVWDARSGQCAGFLPGGHAGGVNALAVLLVRTCGGPSSARVCASF